MPGLTKPRRRALSIAIRYSRLGKSHILPGTHHDPDLLTHILTEYMHFKKEDIVILMDDKHGYRQPTYANILDEMHKLLEDAQPGDHFVFHFAGHGDQILNENGTEEDGKDESENHILIEYSRLLHSRRLTTVIWPVDVELNSDGTAGSKYIVDDTIHDILVDNTPPEAHLMMVFDCCHSGTAADLPNSSTKRPPPKSVRMRSRTHDEQADELELEKHEHSIPMPDVTSWAACADDEVASGNRKGGIFLRSFYEALRANRDATRGELLQDITQRIKNKVKGHNDRLAAKRREHEATHSLEFRGGCQRVDDDAPAQSPELCSSISTDENYHMHIIDEDYD
ncbi:peptidase C14 [Daedalea quercina L-15889]|uniref:Peptidase C14 n=1 Tax=Daedalea quercina L-15889 TaxID=1314783 RepID=A0A165QUD9_9APHY|nr:peptidase C14 [Daedalea quercina L-15889]